MAATGLALAMLVAGVGTASAQTPAGGFLAAPAFSAAGQAVVVFGGGSVGQLEAAARGSGAGGVWAQDRSGAYQLLLVGGPAFLNATFADRFGAGFPGLVSVTLTRPPRPRTFLLDPAALAASRARVLARDPALTAAVARLKRDGDRALTTGPWAVTDKTTLPPSGDAHDYASQSPYYWPDPSTSSGLPYVYRDGQINPERATIPDERGLSSMISTSQSLAVAYYFTGDERYAARAALVLRTWFVDPRTRMNPNLNFAQFVPGKNSGTNSGIIDTNALPEVLDAIGLIDESSALTADDRRGLMQWFTDYLAWLSTSKLGLDEAKTANNHATFYDTQVASIALYLGDATRARTVLEAARARRIATQIEPDGRQPLELARTKAWSYSTFNLEAMFRLAALGDRVGVDLWGYQTSDGRSIRKALDYLVPYATGDQAWTASQITPFVPSELYESLRLAANAYGSAVYRAAAAKAAPPNPDQDRLNLTVPFAP